MAVSPLQNFYKEQIAIACGAGAENIYVSTKPTPTNGFLVISPGSESLREIIKYTGTGTDGDGDFVTVANISDRGLGGTTAQAHEVGEPIRMNYTAEHQKEIDDTIEAIVAGGTPDASTTVKGRAKLSVAPADAADPIAVGTNDARLNATTGLTADEEAALAGGGDFGTPSADNKFLTEESVASNDVFKPIQVVTFTASGTWTKDVGLKYIVVEVVGGGGGGDRGGSGGGGGGYAKKLILASALSATETVTIGAGGVGKTNIVFSTNGETTTFGAHVSATGGVKDGGNGGNGSGGDLNIPGSRSQNDATSSSSRPGGTGGHSFYGFGGAPGVGSGSGTKGGVYGGGGGGGGNSTSANGSGGAGAPGIVIVTEYYS